MNEFVQNHFSDAFSRYSITPHKDIDHMPELEEAEVMDISITTDEVCKQVLYTLTLYLYQIRFRDKMFLDR